MQEPHRIKVGAGVVLLSLDGVAADWGLPEKNVEHLLNLFKIPLIRLPGGRKRYISMYPLEDALFQLGLPETMKGDRALVTAHHELAGVLYGTLTKEVIRERVKILAKSLKFTLTSGTKSDKIKKAKRGRPRKK